MVARDMYYQHVNADGTWFLYVSDWYDDEKWQLLRYPDTRDDPKEQAESMWRFYTGE